jgi:ubiquinone/menaquinone biosynthesis C-methylase UbiE
VLSDVAAEMTAIAARRVDASDLDNVTTLDLDLERIDQPDGSYDLVLCREGLMFAPDPGRAMREIAPVLRPGGVPMRVGSFDEWWARTSALAGPLATILSSLPEPAARALRARAHEPVRPYETSAGLQFRGVTLLATARRP